MLLPYHLNGDTQIYCYGYVAVLSSIGVIRVRDNFLLNEIPKIWNFSFIYIGCSNNIKYATDSRKFPELSQLFSDVQEKDKVSYDFDALVMDLIVFIVLEVWMFDVVLNASEYFSS